MAEDTVIEIRTLAGESGRVSVSSNRSISDLKLLLTRTFPPASSSPNFHLFLKGEKLSMEIQIRSLSMEPHEFIVLVPFIKKVRPPPPLNPVSADSCGQSSNSGYADLVYSDMMQEFSFLHESNTTPSYEPSNAFVGDKRKRDDVKVNDDGKEEETALYTFLWSLLKVPSKSKNLLDDQNCGKFVEILGALNCLKNPHFGICALLRYREDIGIEGDSKVSCLCPAWLQKLVQAFTFLNIFSAYLQMQKEEITSDLLKEALQKLHKYGFGACFEDIEHISILCPKVVSFTKAELASEGLIINISETEGKEIEHKIGGKGGKAMSLSKIFPTMRKRERSFRTDLWTSARLLMCKSGNTSTVLFFLEDLLNFVKVGCATASEKKVKLKKGSWSFPQRSNSSQKGCHDIKPLAPLEMVQHLKEGLGSNGQMVHVEDIVARKAIHVRIPEELSDNTKSALNRMGISNLYSHQAESIMACLAGKNVVVSTMTSSGKSLCYNVPVLEVLSQNMSSCALYLFPTKALAQDQLRALLAMTEGFDTTLSPGIYDGDTPKTERTWLRNNARVLITNPDMLHMSILPFHKQFSRILSNLRFVVVDEAHAYRGAFGCHTALIFRRLRRICSHVYGSDPSFIFSTATSANPREHCMELANLSTLELINNDGSPSAQKRFALWNPVLDLGESDKRSSEDGSASEHKRTSPITEVSHLFAEMIQHGLRCIAFCKSRKLTELVLSYTREILEKTAPSFVDLICAYRAGYTPEDRRKIERDFFGGKLRGVAATNALELGIDVGSIDATLHLGFPGSIASLWQQAGRSGRRDNPSLAVYVAFEAPLDQYFMQFPKKLFNSPIECCHIDAQNQQVLEQHLDCAAFEHPLSLLHDETYFGSGLSKSVMLLKNKGCLSYDSARDSSSRIWNYIGHEKIPSRRISIRAIETEKYTVIDKKDDKTLEEIEESKAFFQVYEGAVYMHQGNTYLVEELKISQKIAAVCRRADLQYYTRTRDYTDIHVLGGELAYPARGAKNQSLKTTAQVNNCQVTTTWFGFYCIEKRTNKILDECKLSLPKYTYESQAAWIQVPQSVKNSVEKKFSFRQGLHAASHALLKVVPLYVRCSSSDLGSECPNPHETRFFPERILVYDQHPGGTGLSVQVQTYFREILNSALELLTSCRCSGSTGCPSCAQSMVCHEYNEEIHKDAAIMIIKGVLDAEKSYFEKIHDSPEIIENN
ncbi:ATP-dependent helicase HRQ1 [Euphorbia peplus]|nr:ATP-dependent helicase HRQ1 [Euphorbia peplus]